MTFFDYILQSSLVWVEVLSIGLILWNIFVLIYSMRNYETREEIMQKTNGLYLGVYAFVIVNTYLWFQYQYSIG